MITITKGSTEEKILNAVKEHYPVDIETVAKILRIRPALVEKTINILVKKGILAIDELPDKKYLRQIRFDISVVGYKDGQKKFMKHAKRRKQGGRKAEENKSKKGKAHNEDTGDKFDSYHDYV